MSTGSPVTPPTTNPVPQRVRDYVVGLDTARSLWIAGRARPAADGATFPVHDPATTDVVGHMADAGEDQVAAAVDAAAAAFPAWRRTDPRERAELLRRTYGLMLRDRAELAGLMAWENGKSVPDAEAEVLYAAEFFRWFAEEAVRSDGDYTPTPLGGNRTIVTHQPVGVSALITPWSFPAAMATRKIAPALAAGCTVMLKAASETPITSLAVVRLLHEAGVPDGVVNYVTSKDSSMVSSTWLADPRVRMLSFTGSTPVGKILMRQAVERVVNVSMELGGNAAFVVGPGADVEAAVAGAMVAKFRNGGQACTAANRFYVHRSVAEEFLERFGAAVSALRVGPAFAEGVAVGPVASARARDSLTALLNRAVAAGARVVAQASWDQGAPGYFVPPTLLVVDDPRAEVVVSEIFGPLAPVVVYDDHEEMVGLVNATEYGLASYVYGPSLEWSLHLAERIEAGMVGVHRGLVSDPAAPFGGMKQSGIGREGAREGLREFQETQYLSVAF